MERIDVNIIFQQKIEHQPHYQHKLTNHTRIIHSERILYLMITIVSLWTRKTSVPNKYQRVSKQEWKSLPRYYRNIYYWKYVWPYYNIVSDTDIIHHTTKTQNAEERACKDTEAKTTLIGLDQAAKYWKCMQIRLHPSDNKSNKKFERYKQRWISSICIRI